MQNADDIHKTVSEAYAKALKKTGPAAGCCGAVQKGVAAQTAGYATTELAALPDDAVVNSFGCGNPLAFAEVKEGEVVLDLGSGAGIDLLIAAKQVGASGRVIGVDMTDDMIARARANIAAAGAANVEVRKGYIEALPLDAASVDWVISNCVINLSPDKPKVFGEIARVLRPGGRMSVSDIVAHDLPDWVLGSAALYSSCVAGAISEADYLQGLRDAGLVDVEVQERQIYDETQIRAFISSEIPGMDEAKIAGMADEIARSVTGKIWSAKFVARKPA